MLALLTAIPTLWRIVGAAAVAAIIIGAFAGWSIHEYNTGWQAAINAVAARDQSALSRVEQGKAVVAACRANGKTWNVVTGECQ